MKTSEEILYLRNRLGEKAAIEALAKAGFDCVDYTMDVMVRQDCILNQPGYLEYAQEIKEFALNLGVSFNQAHAPFEFDWWNVSIENVVIPTTIRCFEIASTLGIDTVIVHPLHYKNYFHRSQEIWEDNLQFFETLLPEAQKYNIRICLENLFQIDKRGVALPDTCADAERYCKFLDTFHDPHLIACIDVGHACLIGEKPADLIRALGHDRLHALHIHDNCAVKDDHTLPYLGKIDWEDVTQALADINYDGILTLESFLFYKNFPDDFLPTAAKWQHDMAAYLATKVDSKRNQLR